MNHSTNMDTELLEQLKKLKVALDELNANSLEVVAILKDIISDVKGGI